MPQDSQQNPLAHEHALIWGDMSTSMHRQHRVWPNVSQTQMMNHGNWPVCRSHMFSTNWYMEQPILWPSLRPWPDFVSPLMGAKAIRRKMEKGTPLIKSPWGMKCGWAQHLRVHSMIDIYRHGLKLFIGHRQVRRIVPLIWTRVWAKKRHSTPSKVLLTFVGDIV